MLKRGHMINANIYLYTNDINKKNHIKQLTKSIGLEFTEIKASTVNSKVSEIVGLPSLTPVSPLSYSVSLNEEENKKAPALWNMPELILFFGVSDAKLDEFLAEYKKTGLEKINLKAIVTPTNLNWTLYYLIEHLKEEAKKFSQ